MNSPELVRVPSGHGRFKIAAWALWDCGATGINAIATTFVFSVYLTHEVGKQLGTAGAAAALGHALTYAGLAVAVLAPATGVWVDAAHRRRPALTVLTVLVVLLTASMSLVRDDPGYLWPGLALLAVTAACSDLATVPYNSMLRDLSTPATSGRISGMGSAAGYFGTVLLLLVVYLGFIAGEPNAAATGLLGITAADGQPVRAAMLLTAAWFALFALPLLLSRRAGSAVVTGSAVGFRGAYAKLWAELTEQWRRDRTVVYYLAASAIFRDGLTGVFTFGAVIGVSVYGLAQDDVLVFGACACVVAAVGAVLGGLVDDRVGAKPVIVGSLTAMIAVGLALLFVDGVAAFWVCGLLLCLFIGPTQSSARTQMLRLSTDGKEGVAFGLYTTSGRAATFLAPLLFATFSSVAGTARAGLGGVITVLALGLIAMLLVKAPAQQSS